MLGWIEKVVPQPPVIPPTPKLVEKAAKPEPKGKESKSGRSRKKAEGKSSQPAGEKKEAVVTPGPGSTTESSGRGVLTWLSDGLEKVVPQPSPPGIVLQQNANTSDAANQTEAQNAEDEGKRGNTKGDPQKGTSPTKPLATHRASVDSHSGLSLFPQRLGGDGGSMFKRIIQGLEKAIPQPVSKEKPVEQKVEAGGLDPGQERSKGA